MVEGPRPTVDRSKAAASKPPSFELASKARPEAESEHLEIVPELEESSLSPEEKQALTDYGISLMRDALSGLDGYAVFASTAMYLYGKHLDIPELKVLPGDFDGVVQNEGGLIRVRERLARVQGIKFLNGGRFGRLKRDGAKFLSGVIEMATQNPDVPHVNYAFEFFAVDTRIITPDVFEKRKTFAGLNLLTFEGLQNQYINNLLTESRVQRHVQNIIEFLVSPQIRKHELKNPDSVEIILGAFKLTEAELDEFYARYDELISLDADWEEIIGDQTIVKLLSGYKTKIPKRTLNVEQLKKLQAIDLSGNTKN